MLAVRRWRWLRVWGWIVKRSAGVAPAVAAGIVPGGPRLSRAEWAGLVAVNVTRFLGHLITRETV